MGVLLTDMLAEYYKSLKFLKTADQYLGIFPEILCGSLFMEISTVKHSKVFLKKVFSHINCKHAHNHKYVIL